MAVGASRGYLYVVTAAALWALSGVTGKLLIATGVTPLELAQLRSTLALPPLALVLALRYPALLRVGGRDLLLFLVLGTLMALTQSSYFWAIEHIQVAAAILLQYQSPILIALFAMIFWRERAAPLKLGALGLAVGGCYLVTGAYDLELLRLNKVGVAAGLVSAVAFASYTLLAERAMHRHRPWTVLLYALCFAALALHGVNRAAPYLTAEYDLRQWGLIAYSVIGGTLVPFALYLTGINHIRSTRANITATLEPIAAGGMAYLLLGEALAAPQIVGGCAVIAAIVLLQVQREADPLAPAAIRRIGR